MPRRIVILFLLMGLVSFKVSAANFIVTSTADAGPGTLREALTLAGANGDTEKDFITFNFPIITEAGRTIRLASQLPDVSSNLVIDGSTQPGNAFGVSKARVTLIVNNTSLLNTIFNLVNVHDITITALSFRGNWLDAKPPSTINGITAQDVNNVQIGAADNGNLFNNLYNGVYMTNATNTTLQGNTSGLTRDGLRPYKNATAFTFKNCASLTIGGALPNQGNILSDYQQAEVLLDNCQDVAIQNNFLGTNYTGNAAVGPSLIGKDIPAYGIFATGGGRFTITNNVLAGLGYAILLKGTVSDYSILNNRIGVGVTLTANLNNRVAITLTNVAGSGTINNNIIAYNQDGVVELNSKPPSISQNSFFCNSGNAIKIQKSTEPVPSVNIITNTAAGISGTATPNSKIELFYIDECNFCQGKTLITTISSNADGIWNYNGTITAMVVGTVTNSAGATSPFSTPTIIKAAVKIKHAECGADGAITGLAYTNANNIQWTNSAGAVVGTNIDLVNVPFGKYQLKVDNGTCSGIPETFEVKDYSFAINTAGIVLKQPSCDRANGRINGIIIINPASVTLYYQWVNNATGLTLAKTLALANAGPGNYTLHVKSAAGCEKTYGPVTLANIAAPQINKAAMVITPSPCGQYTGSIKGITVNGAGTLTYSWKNTSGTEVSNTLDLIDKPGGKYSLQVTVNDACSILFTAIEIPELNGVSLNTTKGKVISASCERANGTITGLQAFGATQTIWTRKADNVEVGNAIDLKNVPADDYVLTLKNATCSKAYDFKINALASSTFSDIDVKVTNTCFAFITGKIEVNTDNVLEVPAAYRWVNSDGVNVAFGKVATYLAEGTYKLYLTNKYGCEIFYKEYTVGKYPPFVNAVYGTINHIICGIGRGSVTTTIFTGGTGNYVYQWYDADNVAIPGKTQPFIDDLSPGAYTLKATDGGCSLSEIKYTIRNDSPVQAPPVLPNINMLVAGTTVIKVTNPYVTALYRLYDTETSPTPDDEQRGGIFNVNITKSRSFFVTLTYGNCESTRTEIKITVNPSADNIANTFTPNNDGINDFWKINGIEGANKLVVTVFNRSGKTVFQSTGYAKPFDGTYMGKDLPAGVYYYTIDLKNGNTIAGTLTILR